MQVLTHSGHGSQSERLGAAQSPGCPTSPHVPIRPSSLGETCSLGSELSSPAGVERSPSFLLPTPCNRVAATPAEAWLKGTKSRPKLERARESKQAPWAKGGGVSSGLGRGVPAVSASKPPSGQLPIGLSLLVICSEFPSSLFDFTFCREVEPAALPQFSEEFQANGHQNLTVLAAVLSLFFYWQQWKYFPVSQQGHFVPREIGAAGPAGSLPRTAEEEGKRPQETQAQTPPSPQERNIPFPERGCPQALRRPASHRAAHCRCAVDDQAEAEGWVSQCVTLEDYLHSHKSSKSSSHTHPAS